MTWEEEYRAKHEEEEELALDHVDSLQAKISKLEKELKRRHRKTVIFTWAVIIAVTAFEIWYYSRH